tara:strand:+ start:24399 stop:25016 length:618 start_codon:yes stop_codon:yes gene_type:complete
MSKDYSKVIRLSIASKAAEIIMEEGIEDYHYAKKKAIKYLDLGSQDTLPSNDEIDKALLEYGSIFQNEIDISTIFKIKEEAIKIMSLFSEFNPLFISQITEGLVPKYPTVNINMFTDNMKEIEYILLNNNFNFETKDSNMSDKKTKRQSKRKIPIISIKNCFFPIKLKVYERYDLKFSKKNLMNARGLNLNDLENFDPNTIFVKA